MERPLELEVWAGEYAVCRLDGAASLPEWAKGPFLSVTRTADELSIVCPVDAVPAGVRAETGWRVLAVAGPLDFSEVGIVGGLTAPLADVGIPVFVVSSYDTDFLLIPAPMLPATAAVLQADGHVLTGA